VEAGALFVDHHVVVPHAAVDAGAPGFYFVVVLVELAAELVGEFVLFDVGEGDLDFLTGAGGRFVRVGRREVE
jgi:hypothetical protein